MGCPAHGRPAQVACRGRVQRGFHQGQAHPGAPPGGTCSYPAHPGSQNHSACGVQDYGIECPGTSSTFSLKTGEIMLWHTPSPAEPADRTASRGALSRPRVQVPEEPGAAADHAPGHLPEAVRLPGAADAGRHRGGRGQPGARCAPDVPALSLPELAQPVRRGAQVASGRSSKSMQQSQNDDVMVMSTQEYVQGEESGGARLQVPGPVGSASAGLSMQLLGVLLAVHLRLQRERPPGAVV